MRDAHPPWASKFFRFHAVFGKIWRVHAPPGGFTPPPRENPGSATDHRGRRLNKYDLITVHKRSLRRLCFYTCLSFCPQGVGSPGPHPGGRLRGHAGGHVSQHAQADTHPHQQTPTAADGTHPIGMHSCWLKQ